MPHVILDRIPLGKRPKVINIDCESGIPTIRSVYTLNKIAWKRLQKNFQQVTTMCVNTWKRFEVLTSGMEILLGVLVKKLVLMLEKIW